MRILKFREPHQCQNGHFRWLFKERVYNQLDDYKLTWGPRHLDCKCPVFDSMTGFKSIGPDEQFTGWVDKNGQDIYENDIVESRYTGVGDEGPPHRAVVIWVDDVDTDRFWQACSGWMVIMEAGFPSREYLMVVGNSHQMSFEYQAIGAKQ